MDPQTASANSATANMAYTHCKTQVIPLRDLDLPDSAAEQEYRDILSRYSQTKTEHSALLIAAINSVRYGIAPPVAFPTETVYGLGADATNQFSIAGIFAAKGRPSDNPLIVHVASKDHLTRVTGESLPQVYDQLVENFWPGPLTILVPVPSNSVFAKNVHPGQKTIGFRVPESKYARFFIATTERPIAAPSANSSGKPSPTTAQHVFDDLRGKVNFILDGGSCVVGVESTVVDGLCDPPVILRPGGVSQGELIAHGKKYGNVWARTEIGYKQKQRSHEGQLEIQADVDIEAPRAPGMKYKHYAPKGKLILFENHQSYDDVISEIDHLIDNALVVTPGQRGDTLRDKHDRGLKERGEGLNIAILTSTIWSNFAELSLNDRENMATSSVETISLDKSNADATGEFSNQTPQPDQTIQTKPKTNESMNQPPVRIGQITTRRYRTATTIHSINLGRTSRQIAQSLFAALRTCDDLGCDYILAEAPMPMRVPVPVPVPVKSTPLPLSHKEPPTTNGDVSYLVVEEDDEGVERKKKADDKEGDKRYGQKTDSSDEGRNQDVHYEAVIERMRKAATHIRVRS